MNTKGKAIGALVCGIVGLVVPWFGFTSIISIILGIIAIILAANVRKYNDANKGMATAGLVLGIISIILGAITTVCVICTVCAVGGSMAVLSSDDWSSLSSLANELSSSLN